MSTTSTSTVLEIVIEPLIEGLGLTLAHMMVVGFVFSFMLGMYVTIIFILSKWRV